MQFVSEVLKEDAEFILQLQLKIAKKYDIFKSGDLQRSLTKSAIGEQNQGTGKKLTIKYIKQLRFLDMYDVRRKIRRYRLYNRVVFGIIYNRTIGKLIYGYTDEVKEILSGQIES
jgi:hypothetical protein